MCNDKLTGIVSFGKGCASPFYPGVYAQVSAFVDWIQNLSQNDVVEVPTSGAFSLKPMFALIFLLLLFK